jgi:hypothetical protein
MHNFRTLSLHATHFWHESGSSAEPFGSLHLRRFSSKILAMSPRLRHALVDPSPSIRLAELDGPELLGVLDAEQTYIYLKVARSDPDFVE